MVDFTSKDYQKTHFFLLLTGLSMFRRERRLVRSCWSGRRGRRGLRSRRCHCIAGFIYFEITSFKFASDFAAILLARFLSRLTIVLYKASTNWSAIRPMIILSLISWLRWKSVWTSCVFIIVRSWSPSCFTVGDDFWFPISSSSEQRKCHNIVLIKLAFHALRKFRLLFDHVHYGLRW